MAHAPSFQILDLGYNHIFSPYGLDDNNVYFNGNIIKNINTKTFEIINDKNNAYNYTKDNNNVYFEGKKITGADPETFKLINSKYAKDKHYVYYHNIMLKGLDIEKVYVNGNNITDDVLIYNNDSISSSSKMNSISAVKKAIEEKNMLICERSSFIGECYFEYSKSLGDVTACEHINGGMKDVCASSFYTEKALSENNIQLCLKLDDGEYCYQEYGKKFFDYGACIMIKDKGIRETCVNYVYVKLLQLGEEEGDVSYCDRLSGDEVLYTKCNFSLLYRLGRKTRDTSYCEKMSDKNNNYYIACLQEIETYIKRDQKKESK
ncbi:hypothetical protein A9Q91_04180 [Candidatus Gracilibacteria bacterium 28_42_T64]|nr:hypothetical protein A9Q91_04180 [Candidatus Gracilibacteria bacterium 28_42_T64]